MGTSTRTIQDLKDELALVESRNINRIGTVELGMNQIKEQMKELQSSMCQMLNSWQKTSQRNDSGDSSQKILKEKDFDSSTNKSTQRQYQEIITHLALTFR